MEEQLLFASLANVNNIGIYTLKEVLQPEMNGIEFKTIEEKPKLVRNIDETLYVIVGDIMSSEELELKWLDKQFELADVDALEVKKAKELLESKDYAVIKVTKEMKGDYKSCELRHADCMRCSCRGELCPKVEGIVIKEATRSVVI